MSRKIGYPYSYGDYLSPEEARANLTISRGCSIAFATGFTYYLLSPAPAYADDNNVIANEAKKAAAKRITNAIGCGAIMAAWGKPKATEAVAQQAASVDPRIAGAFICGAAVAWCTKYIIFDR